MDKQYAIKVKNHIQTHFSVASDEDKKKIFDLVIDVNSFDEEYYSHKYPYLGTPGEQNWHAGRHWIMHGIFEGKLCSKKHEKLCKDIVQKYLKIHLERRDVGGVPGKTVINVLTRTSSDFFNMAIIADMLEKQNYPFLRNIISYDNSDYANCINLSRIKNSEMVRVFPKKKINYFYNLYCNTLLSTVKEGWVMFLDDDDELVRNDTIRHIMHIVSYCNNDDLLIFHNYRDDKIIQIHDRVSPKIGEVCISSFVFHSSAKNLSWFTDKSHGDFDFFKRLFRRLKPRFFDFPTVKINHWT